MLTNGLGLVGWHPGYDPLLLLEPAEGRSYDRPSFHLVT